MSRWNSWPPKESPYPCASPGIQVRVYRNTDNGHGIHEYPHECDSCQEDLVGNPPALDHGEEGVYGNRHNERPRCQISDGNEPAIRPARVRSDLDLVGCKVTTCQCESHGLLNIGQQQIVDEEKELIGTIPELAFEVPGAQAIREIDEQAARGDE